MKENILYKDALIEITKKSLKLRNYYLPFISKTILFKNIKDIESKEINIGERLRKYGIGSYNGSMTWMPYDPLKYKRDIMFIITYKKKWIKTAFTVEDGLRVERIFREKDWVSRIF